ncbi:hypothetical protein [Chondrinema litorale]|uniref:hypothetical protein n=1 Tax=Chondrinema litorale TaxID=2994555 RepID=UPI002542E77C|nr:hypothetical protein [Chondrinema litorale]UZR99925.1 hypothetical protein OQ292_38785 [Chondrinema litorale]
MSKKLNVSGLFSSDPLPEEDVPEVIEKKEEPEKKVVNRKPTAKTSQRTSQKVVSEKPKEAVVTKKVEVEEVSEEPKNVNLKLNLGKIKKKKPIDYISFKLKRDVHNHLTKIAKKENIDYTGNLIHLILEDFIKQYNQDD